MHFEIGHCDNCSEKARLEFIKWPGLDTGIQYQSFCEPCRKNFYKRRRNEVTNNTKLQND